MFDSILETLGIKSKEIYFPSPKDPNCAYYYQRKAEFDADTVKGGPLFIGDSITDNGRNLHPEFFKDTIRNYGILGDTTIGLAMRLGSVLKASPDKIFMMIGTNNLGSRIIPGKATGKYIFDVKNPIDKVVNKLVSDYINILQILRKGLPDCKIYVQSILPVNTEVLYKGYVDLNKILKTRSNVDIINTNIILKNMCDNFPDITFLDLYPFFVNSSNQMDPGLVFDGLHPNKKGYILWESIVKSLV